MSASADSLWWLYLMSNEKTLRSQCWAAGSLDQWLDDDIDKLQATIKKIRKLVIVKYLGEKNKNLLDV